MATHPLCLQLAGPLGWEPGPHLRLSIPQNLNSLQSDIRSLAVLGKSQWADVVSGECRCMYCKRER
jgi:hypothetical protein